MMLSRRRAVELLPVAIWSLFFVTLALYQLPDTRISSALARLPYFVVPGGVAVVITLFGLSRADLGRFRLELGLLAVLVVATLLTGLLNHHQAWASAAKRVGYLAIGVATLHAAWQRPAVLRPAMAAYALTAAAMAVFGFALLLTGFGEAAGLLYWGLHYTAGSRNGDSFFIVLPAFMGLYLAFTTGSRVAAAVLGIADAVLWLAVAYSFSRGTWVAAGVGVLLFALLLRSRRVWAGVVISLIATMAIMSIPLHGHRPLQELIFRAGTITSTETVAKPPAGVPNGAVSNSNRERLALLAAGAPVILHHPLAGIGVEGLNHVEFKGPSHGVVGTLEDCYLTALAEYGILGLLVTLGIVILPILRLIGGRSRGGWILVGGMVAFGINGLTFSALSSAWWWILPLLVLAAALPFGPLNRATLLAGFARADSAIVDRVSRPGLRSGIDLAKGSDPPAGGARTGQHG